MVRPRGRPRGGRPRVEHDDQEPDPRADSIQQQILNMLTQQQATMNEIRRDLREVQERQDRLENLVRQEEELEQPEDDQQGPYVPIPEADILQTWLSRFCKQQPPMFKGRLEPQLAEDWLARMDKIFKILRCPDEIKVQLAIYKLEGEADRWWRNTEPVMQARNIPVTWESFLENFNEKYFPRSVRLEKEREFLRITQGETESFDEYLSRYTRLSRYSSYLRYKDDEEWKSDMMIQGLRHELKEKLVSKRFKEFNQAVEECRITESNLLNLHVDRSKGVSGYGNSSQKRKDQNGPPRVGNKKPFLARGRGGRGFSQGKTCWHCNKPFHPGKTCSGAPLSQTLPATQTPARQIVYHHCQKSGHYSMDCP